MGRPEYRPLCDRQGRPRQGSHDPRSADRKIFDEATINAIRHWRFRPMIKDGEAMEAVHELTIRYRLTV
jgi:hypothetical protein